MGNRKREAGQSEWSLLVDNRSLSKLSQGITTEITREGNSIAPQNAKTLTSMKLLLDYYKFTVDWTTFDGYFRRLEKQGTPLNIGTYVGAGQVHKGVIGDDDGQQVGIHSRHTCPRWLSYYGDLNGSASATGPPSFLWLKSSGDSRAPRT